MYYITLLISSFLSNLTFCLHIHELDPILIFPRMNKRSRPNREGGLATGLAGRLMPWLDGPCAGLPAPSAGCSAQIQAGRPRRWPPDRLRLQIFEPGALGALIPLISHDFIESCAVLRLGGWVSSFLKIGISIL